MLGQVLSHSVHLYYVRQKKGLSQHIVKHAVAHILRNIDRMDEKRFREVKDVLVLMTENL